MILRKVIKKAVAVSLTVVLISSFSSFNISASADDAPGYAPQAAAGANGDDNSGGNSGGSNAWRASGNQDQGNGGDNASGNQDQGNKADNASGNQDQGNQDQGNGADVSAGANSDAAAGANPDTSADAAANGGSDGSDATADNGSDAAVDNGADTNTDTDANAGTNSDVITGENQDNGSDNGDNSSNNTGDNGNTGSGDNGGTSAPDTGGFTIGQTPPVQDNPGLDARLSYLSPEKTSLLKLLFSYESSIENQNDLEYFVVKYLQDADAAQIFARLATPDDVTAEIGTLLQSCQQVKAQEQDLYNQFIDELNKRLLADNFVSLNGQAPAAEPQPGAAMPLPAAASSNASTAYADIPDTGSPDGLLKAFSSTAAPAANFRTYDASFDIDVNPPSQAPGYNGPANIIFMVDVSESVGRDIIGQSRKTILQSVVNQLNLGAPGAYNSAWVVVFGGKKADGNGVNMFERINNAGSVDQVWADVSNYFSLTLPATDDNTTDLAGAINFVTNSLSANLARTTTEGARIPTELLIMSDFEQSVAGSLGDNPVQADIDNLLSAASNARDAGFDLFSLYEKSIFRSNGAKVRQWAMNLGYQITGAYYQLPDGTWAQNDPDVIRFFYFNTTDLSDQDVQSLIEISDQIRDNVTGAGGIAGAVLTASLSPAILANFDIVGFDANNYANWLKFSLTDQDGNPILDDNNLVVTIIPDTVSFNQASGLLTLSFADIPAGVCTVKFTLAAHGNYDGDYNGTTVLTGGAKDLGVFSSIGLAYGQDAASYAINQSPAIDVPPLYNVTLTCDSAAVWKGSAVNITPAVNIHWPASVNSYAELISASGAGYRLPAEWGAYYDLARTLTCAKPGGLPAALDTYTVNQPNAFAGTSAAGVYTFSFGASIMQGADVYFNSAASVEFCAVSGLLRINVVDPTSASDGDIADVMLKGSADSTLFHTAISVGNFKQFEINRDYDLKPVIYMPYDYQCAADLDRVSFDLAGLLSGKYQSLVSDINAGAAGVCATLYGSLSADLARTLTVNMTKADTPFFKSWLIYNPGYGNPII